MTAAYFTTPVTSWRRPPETTKLGDDEVHVWRASLARTPAQFRRLFNGLAVDEQARAERFHFDRDRTHFVVARGVLRAILGRYLKQAPERISFQYGAFGKPAIAGAPDGNAIRFNVSHSRGEALYAVTRGREVGIDLERVRFDLAVAEIAGRFFSQREAATLRALPIEAQHQAFFRIWTYKEAYIKARGEGLSMPLNEFDVLPASGHADATIGAASDPPEVSRWSVRPIAASPGYAAALAAEAGSWRVSCWQWR